ncbi:MAG: hypothetical protein KA731_03630 [Candidatus Moranbacteria bacterium]|nr:hypothetical protein [Candidatus Moranbacteria bacterium]MBP6034260.1 hypothetical protein [Candidatus Moranbacteria bacterium]MBP7695914.1 hypothetical protein [Candidatus Moranbacteria bacterium]
MKKQIVTLDEKGYQVNADRLTAIAETVLGTLSDESVLELLAERRTLEKENTAYERERDEKEQRVQAAAAERQAIEQALVELNTSITPDKDDDTLLALVAERKKLEAKLAALGESEEIVVADPIPEAEASEPVEEKSVEEPEKIIESPVAEEVAEEPAAASKPEPVAEAVAPAIADVEPEEATKKEEKVPQKILDERIGGERINMATSSADAKEFLQLLEENPDDALSRLESLPDELKKDKGFMLKVAAVDPAYAMHYADAKTLKKNEEFNVKIASMNNPRNSGNPLAEMLSEARTAPVVMAAVKNDFRNLRYAMPDMEGYTDMLEIAKKQAREKVKALGQAVDLRMFLPKALRDDQAFLEEAEQIIKDLKEKQQ